MVSRVNVARQQITFTLPFTSFREPWASTRMSRGSSGTSPLHPASRIRLFGCQKIFKPCAQFLNARVNRSCTENDWRMFFRIYDVSFSTIDEIVGPSVYFPLCLDNIIFNLSFVSSIYCSFYDIYKITFLVKRYSVSTFLILTNNIVTKL